MELDQESQKLFMFLTHFELYKFKRLIQGISPASAECHEKLRTIFKGLKGVVQIKDDLVVHGKGEQHDERLDKLLRRCNEYDVTLRAEKCKFGQDQVTWFGNVYTKHGMSPDPEKVDLIRAWP